MKPGPEDTPTTLNNLVTSEVPDSAAGLTAVTTALRRVLRAMPARRAARVLFNLNQKDGVDCPGCAWPDPDHRSALGEYCENGAKAIAEEATSSVADPALFRMHSVEELARLDDYTLGQMGRLTSPMILRQGETHYHPLSWDEAFGIIAEKLKSLEDPNEAVFYTSGRTSNEAAFLYQLFVRIFGTNNLPDCSNMCHESSGAALSETVGIGKGSVTLEDFYESEVVIVAGQNPGTNHPRMLSALEKAKENGATIISVNPLNEAGLSRFKNPQKAKGIIGRGTRLADIYVQLRINGDVPFVKALLKTLITRDRQDPGSVLDHDFIQKSTTGYETLTKHLDECSIDLLCEDAGVSLETVERVSDVLEKSEKIICCWAMGLTQHVNAVDNIREYVNLLLVKGSIGKPGAGTCPVRGHSNVQGDRTVGIWEKIPDHTVDFIRDVVGIDPPLETGYDTVNAIRAMADGNVRVFFAMGGNFVSATPDTSNTADGLRKCDLTVHVSTKLNRSHLVAGKSAMILPCLARSDVDMTGGKKQFVTVENSMGRVHRSSGVVPPVSDQLLSEPEIVARLASRTLPDPKSVKWMDVVTDYDRIRDMIEKCVPGFDSYNERVREPGGFYLPNPAREGRFDTSSGKAVFSINSYHHAPGLSNELMMMTIRSHDQFNTTIYGFDDRYRGIKGERRVILMNPEDAAERSLSARDVVDIESNYDGVKRVARNFQVVYYDIPQSCVATYFPEANVLIPLDHVAHTSNTPASKLVRVSINRVE
ncbi:MAG: FdhF/YdeP family oxidoreductase [Rhodothermales bacterium]|nr:FdhF/YdeP family oxidoreductase [Rhodothermales bacterium]